MLKVIMLSVVMLNVMARRVSQRISLYTVWIQWTQRLIMPTHGQTGLNLG
jgi:hypothetical protein